MNKKVFIVFICVFLLCGCVSNTSEKENGGLYKDASIKVSEIHDSDITEYEFLEDDDPAFMEISFEDACKFFRNKWSGIIYFGHVGCPWCERAVPVLNEVAKKANVLVYYVDASKDVGKNDKESDKLFEEMKGYISSSYREDENGELTLASTVSYVGKDYRVTTVQGSAFLSCTDIKKLIVPANIKYIQSGAFENCVNMNKLVLAEGEERLDAESDAFKNCGIEEATIGRNLKTSIFVRNAILTKVVFGSNIKNIPDNAFYGCSNLSSVDLSNVESIGNSAFASTKL